MEWTHGCRAKQLTFIIAKLLLPQPFHLRPPFLRLAQWSLPFNYQLCILLPFFFGLAKLSQVLVKHLNGAPSPYWLARCSSIQVLHWWYHCYLIVSFPIIVKFSIETIRQGVGLRELILRKLRCVFLPRLLNADAATSGLTFLVPESLIYVWIYKARRFAHKRIGIICGSKRASALLCSWHPQQLRITSLLGKLNGDLSKRRFLIADATSFIPTKRPPL